MKEILKLNENIYAVITPYKDIFTTTVLIKTDTGAFLFDTASFACDVTDTILPMLRELSVPYEDLRCVFISHNHNDHAGGLGELVRRFPNLPVYSNSPTISARYEGTANVRRFEDGEEIMPGLVAIKIPGHTEDSAAILDKRTGSLITGDCLQLYGILGSGEWGANIRYPKEHLAALEKIRNMPEIVNVYTAHDYVPYGSRYEGREAVLAAFTACEEPLLKIRRLIDEKPDLGDDAIAALYNSDKNLPTVGAHVVAAVRANIQKTSKGEKTMKKVTLLGDSIRRIGYGLKVPELLGEEYEVYQPEDNCRFAKYTLLGLDDWKKELAGSDVIHWNNGLWDVCNRFGDGSFSSKEEYVSNMLRVARLLKRITPNIIFATTTPVHEGQKTIKDEVIREYNAAIVPELIKMDIKINDLYSFVRPHIHEYVREDDKMHLTEQGIAACSEVVVKCIKEFE